MVAWMITLGYLAIGYFLGRKAFVRILGDANRTYKITNDGLSWWTTEFTQAFWVAIMLFTLWPTTLPIISLIRPTPSEKTAKLEQQKRNLEKELRRLELEYDLDFRKDKWNA